MWRQILSIEKHISQNASTCEWNLSDNSFWCCDSWVSFFSLIIHFLGDIPMSPSHPFTPKGRIKLKRFWMSLRPKIVLYGPKNTTLQAMEVNPWEGYTNSHHHASNAISFIYIWLMLGPMSKAFMWYTREIPRKDRFSWMRKIFNYTTNVYLFCSISHDNNSYRRKS